MLIIIYILLFCNQACVVIVFLLCTVLRLPKCSMSNHLLLLKLVFSNYVCNHNTHVIENEKLGCIVRKSTEFGFASCESTHIHTGTYLHAQAHTHNRNTHAQEHTHAHTRHCYFPWEFLEQLYLITAALQCQYYILYFFKVSPQSVWLYHYYCKLYMDTLCKE